jgi:hypothetical protein
LSWPFFVLLTGFWAFDRLVHLEYVSYREQWEADGRLHGFLSIPRECKAGIFVRFGCSWARNRCSMAWLFKTPEWMRQDQRALRFVRWMRASWLTWNVGIVGPFLFFAFTT